MTYRMGDISQSVFKEVLRQGFDIPVVESARPKVPSDITSVGAHELMTLFVELTEFAATQLAFAEIDERSAIAKAAQKYNALMSAPSSDSRSSKVTFQKSQASANPEYLDLQKQSEFATAYKDLLKAVYENLDRDLRVVSREITRRSNSTEQRSNRFSA